MLISNYADITTTTTKTIKTFITFCYLLNEKQNVRTCVSFVKLTSALSLERFDATLKRLKTHKVRS